VRFLKTSCRYVLTSSSPLLNLLSNFEMTTLILAQRQQTRDPNRKVYTPPFARSYHGFTLSRLDMMTPNLECGGRTSRLIADKSSLRASLPETHFDLTARQRGLLLVDMIHSALILANACGPSI